MSKPTTQTPLTDAEWIKMLKAMDGHEVTAACAIQLHAFKVHARTIEQKLNEALEVIKLRSLICSKHTDDERVETECQVCLKKECDSLKEQLELYESICDSARANLRVGDNESMIDGIAKLQVKNQSLQTELKEGKSQIAILVHALQCANNSFFGSPGGQNQIDNALANSAQAAKDFRDGIINECLAVIPGGQNCDPQEIADAIRELLSKPAKG